ncbi:MAG: glycosyltransferase family 2 protein [Nanoarchaeota archaeon]|nr:glycosyltransferase family 2 protein [Nanoarchaeota archaeon]
MQPRIVVTIPAYNEEKTIGQVVTSIKEVMNKHRHNYRILIVDDGSTDKTVAIARKLGAMVHSHPKNYGLAETFNTELDIAVQEGFDIIVHFDADGQYLAKDIPRLIEVFKQGNDLVLGSRFKGKIEKMSLLKRMGNKAFSRVVSNICGLKISDAQTGFRVFSKEVARIRVASSYTYTQEQIIRAVKAKFKIAEVPVYFARRKDKSRLMRNPFHFAASAGVNLLRTYRDYQPLKFFGWIGGISFSVGFIVGLVLLYFYITTGTILGRIPTAILSVMFILVGMQIILFGFLADMKR